MKGRGKNLSIHPHHYPLPSRERGFLWKLSSFVGDLPVMNITLKVKIPRLPFWVWTLGGVLTILAFNLAITLPTYTTTKKEFCITCHHQQRESPFWEQSPCIPRLTVLNVMPQATPLCRASISSPLKAKGNMQASLQRSIRSIQTASGVTTGFLILNEPLLILILTISQFLTVFISIN
jgi:hypothetical protein